MTTKTGQGNHSPLFLNGGGAAGQSGQLMGLDCDGFAAASVQQQFARNTEILPAWRLQMHTI